MSLLVISKIILRSVKILTVDHKYSLCNPMDTSLSIRHEFNVEIPSERFVEIISILKRKFTWNL